MTKKYFFFHFKRAAVSVPLSFFILSGTVALIACCRAEAATAQFRCHSGELGFGTVDVSIKGDAPFSLELGSKMLPHQQLEIEFLHYDMNAHLIDRRALDADASPKLDGRGAAAAFSATLNLDAREIALRIPPSRINWLASNAPVHQCYGRSAIPGVTMVLNLASGQVKSPAQFIFDDLNPDVNWVEVNEGNVFVRHAVLDGKLCNTGPGAVRANYPLSCSRIDSHGR